MRKLTRALLGEIAPIIVVFLGLFFDHKHLRGRHFEGSFAGQLWGLRAIWTRNILRLDKTYPFPVVLGARISNAQNITFHPDNLDNFQSPGLYLQNFLGHITLGHGCYLAPNVGIITANHDPLNPNDHLEAQDVIIGEGCWIGMNSVILPGVVLGPRTVVGAGSVVTRSFPDGYAVIAGSPARPIKSLVAEQEVT